ncbi:MAG TPA: TolC family protein [Thermoanaerobaculia bacterium]
MKKPIGLAVAALCVFAATPAPGEDAAAPRVTLAEALRLARAQNPDLLAARADLESARAQRATAVALPNPALAYATSKIATDGSPANTTYGNAFYNRSYDTVVSASQLVEIGGKRKDRRVSADEGIAGATARLADTARLLEAAVVRAYTAALVARASAAIARETAASFGKTAGLATEREAAGEISTSEKTQIEIAAGRFLADAAQADLAYANAARALAALLNLPSAAPAEDLDAPGEITQPDSPATPNDDAFLARRPDLASLEAAVRKAEAELALQKAFRTPDPTLLAQYERQPPDQRNTVGFGVSFPLPVFNLNGGGIHASRVAVESARRDLARGRVRVRQDLAATRDAFETAQLRALRLVNDLLPKAQTVRDTVRFAYEQGAASLLELLEAERNANDIRLAAISARGDLAAARADFRAARPGTDTDTGRK